MRMYKCPKCRERDIWSINSRTADLGSYGCFSWIRCQCQKCGHIWVEKIQHKTETDTPPKAEPKRKKKVD